MSVIDSGVCACVGMCILGLNRVHAMDFLVDAEVESVRHVNTSRCLIRKGALIEKSAALVFLSVHC